MEKSRMSGQTAVKLKKQTITRSLGRALTEEENKAVEMLFGDAPHTGNMNKYLDRYNKMSLEALTRRENGQTR